MSTETKWTPGPWRSVISQRGFVVVSHDDTYDIAVVRDIGNENNEANATLIAESPELYKALEALTGVVQSDPFLRYSEDSLYGKAIKGALAALKKARGE